MKKSFSKGVLTFILASSMVLASGGCSSKKSGESRTDRNQRKDAEDTVAETTVAETTQKLAAPGNFACEPQNPDSVKLSWNTVSGAQSYELAEDNQITYKTASTVFDSYKPTKKYGSISLRAADGDRKSDWVTVEYDLRIFPSTPGDVKYTLSGQLFALYWTPVNGASGYRYYTDSDKTPIEVSDNYCYLSGPVGTTEGFYLSAFTIVNGKKYYSDPQKWNIKFPTFDLNNIKDVESCILSFDLLQSWIKLKQYTSTSYTSNGYTYVIVSKKDEKNSGFLNALSRAAEAYFDGYVDSIPDALKDNLADAILEGQSFKDYADSVDKDANKSGILAALEAAFSDTSINIVYRYKADRLYEAPWDVNMYYLKTHRDNFEKESVGNATIQSDGYYHFYGKSTDTDQQSYAVRYSSDGNYWVVYEARTDFDKNSPFYYNLG